MDLAVLVQKEFYHRFLGRRTGMHAPMEPYFPVRWQTRAHRICTWSDIREPLGKKDKKLATPQFRLIAWRAP